MQNIAVGFDLGTTKSVASIVNEKGRPVDVRGPSGRHLIPSAVYFDTNVVVGESAMELGLRDVDGFAEAFKREIGNPHYSRRIRSYQVPPEVLTAFLVRQLIANVRQVVGEVTEAVVTVPAYFDEKKRTATQHAVQLAGLQVQDIINEPTAAAIAAGHEMILRDSHSGGPRRLLVYDLGGGTFDVTLLEFERRTFRAIATDGDIFLGGRDFDERLAGIMAARFIGRHGIDPRGELRHTQQLWKSARDLKHLLSDRESVQTSLEFSGLSATLEIRRAEFEEAIEPLIERSMSTTRDVVRDAGLTWSDIDEFLLVGGSSRIPLIARKAEELWGRTPQLAANPDELIAHGAALYAAAKRGDFLDADARFDVVNVNAHSLGIQGIDVATNQKVNKILIPRNSPLPVSKSRNFETFRDGQKRVPVRLLEGESDNPDFCTLLGDCTIHIDPPMPKGAQIRVSCNYAANGTISVTAKLVPTNTTAYVEMRRDGHSTLEPLEVWAARLTGAALPATSDNAAGLARPSSKPPADLSDKGQVLARLDELYSYIGALSAEGTPPAGAIQTHRLVALLTEETGTLKQLIEAIEVQHQRADQLQSRLELAGRLAQARMAWEHSMRLLNHSRMALGRECVAENVVVSAAFSYLGEVRELQSLIDE